MEEYIALFVFLWLLWCGVFIAFTPAKTLLSFQRQANPWLYRRPSRPGYSEEDEINRAAIFYKLLGGSFILVSTGFLIALVATWLR